MNGRNKMSEKEMLCANPFCGNKISDKNQSGLCDDCKENGNFEQSQMTDHNEFF